MSAIRLGYITLIIFCFIYLLILQIHAAWPFTIDDMYITLRYAKHWSEGAGLLWNIGEPPVEGYSNFIFVVLGRAAYFFDLNPVVVLKSAGVVGLFVLTGALFRLSRLWMAARFAFIPCVWLLAYRGQILWSVSGLETSVYEVWVVLSVYFLLRGLGYRVYPLVRLAPHTGAFVAAGLCLALAGMTRPEAPALMLLFLGLVVVYAIRDTKRASWSCFWVLITVLLVFFTPYFLWRWHYFGQLFPNTVYCKGAIRAFDFSLDMAYLRLIWPFVLCALPVLWRHNARGFAFLWWPSVVYLALCAGADPVVGFDNRLFLPAFALFLPLALCGLICLFVKPRRVYVCSFLMLFLFVPGLSLKNYQHFTENPQSGARLREQVVAWLSQHTVPGDTVVLGDCGLIPYQSTLRFTDSYCLNNIKMTQAPREVMYTRFCQQLWVDKPHVIILTALVTDGIVTYAPADQCLAEQLRHQTVYRKQVTFRSETQGFSYYRYVIYTRDL